MKKIYVALSAFLYSAKLYAQEDNSQLEIAVEERNDEWYASPWLWVISAALIIVLLVALSNRKESKD
ncbi:hypothetical protein HRH25_07415 [Flavisolibacter sp. BT320]|nr:hypothetical protein [Flavisolibacter longurius]